MLGRKSYTPEEIERGRAAVGEQLDAYRRLAATIGSGSSNGEAAAALADFEGRYFTNLVLGLDRPYVHRLRTATGKDGNALNEVELLVESLLNNGGVLRTGNVVKWRAEESVLGLRPGDRINLNREQFERLASAFFGELERRFIASA